MARLRLAILGESPCGRCVAACCKQNGHAYAVLLDEGERRKFAAFADRATIRHEGRSSIEFVLPYRVGRCIFLLPDDRCAIYEDRPTNCRRFQCVEHFHHRGATIGEHDVFLERNPHVLRLLGSL